MVPEATSRRSGIAMLALMAIGLAGCVTEINTAAKKLKSDRSERRIVMMPADIELSIKTAGGLLEPNAQWTAQAKTHVNQALKAAIAKMDAQAVDFQPPQVSAGGDKMLTQLINLHGVVGSTILRYHFASSRKLPHKQGKFDWTLGKDVAALGAGSDAQFALFVYYRDSYASAGRVAAMVAAAFTLSILKPGRQTAFASLVDLRTGDIVWFSKLFQRNGDLRDLESAKRSVSLLLRNFPK